MNCRDIDLVRYMDGNAGEDIRIHIEGCKNCSEELGRLKNFSQIISGQYAVGKKLEIELNAKLAAIDMTKMIKLPQEVAIKAAEMKKKSLASRLKKVVGEKSKKVNEFLENIMSPQMQVMPASPKDITQIKKKRKKKTS